jgi:nucleoside 2-deoxyribosyltransferase
MDRRPGESFSIYFAAAMAGGRQYVHEQRRIVAHLRKLGHNVLSEHVVDDAASEAMLAQGIRACFEYDIASIEASHLVVAEVSVPSLGTGYEICYALERGIPVACLYAESSPWPLSLMLEGNPSPLLAIFRYTSPHLEEKVEEALAWAREVRALGSVPRTS